MSARFLSVYLFTHLQSPASRRRGASGIIYKHEHGTDVRTGIAALSADLNWKLINPLQADAASFQRQPDWRSDPWHVGGCARLARAPSWWHHSGRLWSHVPVAVRFLYTLRGGNRAAEHWTISAILRSFCCVEYFWRKSGLFENEPTAPAQSRHTPPHGSSEKPTQRKVPASRAWDGLGQ